MIAIFRLVPWLPVPCALVHYNKEGASRSRPLAARHANYAPYPSWFHAPKMSHRFGPFVSMLHCSPISVWSDKMIENYTADILCITHHAGCLDIRFDRINIMRTLYSLAVICFIPLSARHDLKTWKYILNPRLFDSIVPATNSILTIMIVR